MGTPVRRFIKEAHTLYNIPYSLTEERMRKLRYKLKMADIVKVVKDEDEKLATDIILADYNKSGSNLRTAAIHRPQPGGGVYNIRSAGMCPRCSKSMQFAKLADSSETKYCSNCHVCMR